MTLLVPTADFVFFRWWLRRFVTVNLRAFLYCLVVFALFFPPIPKYSKFYLKLLQTKTGEIDIVCYT